jgi:hypothetical protein
MLVLEQWLWQKQYVVAEKEGKRYLCNSTYLKLTAVVLLNNL